MCHASVRKGHSTVASDTPIADEQLHELPRDLSPGESEERIRSRDVKRGLASIDKTVFGWSFGVIVAIIVLGMVFTKTVGSIAGEVLTWLINSFGWLFVLSASGFVVFASGAGGRPLRPHPAGRDGEEPEFRTSSWVAMMFSAGMGIGLMFYGVTEPLTHFATAAARDRRGGAGRCRPDRDGDHDVPLGPAPVGDLCRRRAGLAYGTFREGRGSCSSAPPFRRSSARPRAKGRPARSSTSSRSSRRSSAPRPRSASAPCRSAPASRSPRHREGRHAVLVAIIARAHRWPSSCRRSPASPKGIQWLSNINMVLALALALFVFVVGPTVFILNLLPTTIGSYFKDLAMMSARTDAARRRHDVAGLAGRSSTGPGGSPGRPSSGMFIARISQGRTIRQFVVGVMLVPSAGHALWFAVFGGAGIELQQRRHGHRRRGRAAARVRSSRCCGTTRWSSARRSW